MKEEIIRLAQITAEAKVILSDISLSIPIDEIDKQNAEAIRELKNNFNSSAFAIERINVERLKYQKEHFDRSVHSFVLPKKS